MECGLKLDIVANAFSSTTWEAVLCELKVSLVYIASFRIVKSFEKPCLKSKTKQKIYGLKEMSMFTWSPKGGRFNAEVNNNNKSAMNTELNYNRNKLKHLKKKIS